MYIHLFAFLGIQAIATVSALSAQEQQGQEGTPIIPCASLTAPALPGASVLSLNAAEVHDFNITGNRRFPTSTQGTKAAVPPLNFCDVNVTITHGNDSVRIEVWLPLTGWNGRFQGTGGGGFIAGEFGPVLGPQVANGYVAASTDAGLRPMSFDGSSIQFDEQLLKNFASLSVHEMAVIGKNLSEAFYGKPPAFSYWNGCSTGGRQGYMEAQRFPEDFDGILAAAPAINWARFVPAEIWPFAVQKSGGEFVSRCVLNAIVTQHIAACDMDDGAADKMIADPATCRFDTRGLVGTSVACNDTTGSITEQHVDVYNKILNGPTSDNGTQLWFGFLPGTNPALMSQKRPFSLASSWINNFVTKSNASQSLTMDNFADSFTASEVQFGVLLNTDSPDLTAFRKAGGKLLTWHGLGDPIIPPQGTINYRQKVEAMMGGGSAVDSFYRLFFAPGVQHCGGGNGPQPASVLDSLVDWVEKGIAPETLPAETADSKVTRNLCRYPLTLKYKGTGNFDKAENWNCAGANISQSETAGGSASFNSKPNDNMGNAARTASYILACSAGVLSAALFL